MTEHWLVTATQDAATRISALAHAGALDEPVDHLNRWKVRDVVAHLGGIHRWATRIVRERSMAGPGFRKSKLDGTALCEWFDDGAEQLIAEFNAHDLAAECPNFNPGSTSTIEWWARRQAHETTVHRWDIEKALACITAIPAATAADGVDEFLDVFVRTRGKQTLAASLTLQTTPPRRTWTLTPAEQPGRIDVLINPPDSDSADATTTVTGEPEAMLLALWGRLTIAEADLTIDGDITAAESLLRS